MNILNFELYDTKKFKNFKTKTFIYIPNSDVLVKEAYLVSLGIEEIIKKFPAEDIADLVLTPSPIIVDHNHNIAVFGNAYRKSQF